MSPRFAPFGGRILVRSLVVALALHLSCIAAFAQDDISTHAKIDILQKKIGKAFAARNSAEILRLIDELKPLFAPDDYPPPNFYFEALAAHGVGDHRRALTALKAYLAVADDDSPYYKPATDNEPEFEALITKPVPHFDMSGWTEQQLADEIAHPQSYGDSEGSLTKERSSIQACVLILEAENYSWGGDSTRQCATSRSEQRFDFRGGLDGILFKQYILQDNKVELTFTFKHNPISRSIWFQPYSGGVCPNQIHRIDDFAQSRTRADYITNGYMVEPGYEPRQGKLMDFDRAARKKAAAEELAKRCKNQ